MFECWFKRNKKKASNDIEYVQYEEIANKDEVTNDYFQLIIPEGKIPLKCPKCDSITRKCDYAEDEMKLSDATILKNTLVSRMKIKSVCPICGTSSVHYFKFDKIMVTHLTNIMTGEKINLEEEEK